MKTVGLPDDAVVCDLLEHFLGLATHDNVNAPPSSRVRAPSRGQDADPFQGPTLPLAGRAAPSRHR